MSAVRRLARVLVARSGRDVELALATQDGQTLRVLASEDQIDRLVDELEDILNSPAGDEPGDGPEPDGPEA